MANWWEDNVLIAPVDDFAAGQQLVAEREQAFDQKRQADAQQRLSYQKGLGGDTLSQLDALNQEVGADFMSPVMRLIGQDEVADELNRNSAAIEAEIVQREEGGPVPDWLQRNVRGGLRSVPPIVIGGRLGSMGGGAMGGVAGANIGGTAGAISTAMGMEANQAITEGRDAGLEGGELAAYAASQGAIEGAVATVFSKVGMGGAESMFAANAISGGVRQAAKQAAVRVGQEIPEEITTEIAHAIAADYAGTREDGLSNESLAQLAFDTTMQTIVTMGAMEGPRLAAQALSRPEQQGEQLTPEQMAEVEEFHRVQQERERLAREQDAQAQEPAQEPVIQQPVPGDSLSPGVPVQSGQPGVPAATSVTPTAGETSNVPPAQPREEVIQNEAPEESLQQGNVQRDQEGLRDEGGQGQVGTEPIVPVSPQQDAVNTETPESSAEGGRTSPPSVPAQESPEDSPEDSTPAARPGGPLRKKLLGNNRNGEPVYERPSGQRYVINDGVEIEEKATLRPVRRIDGRIEYVGEVDPDAREDRFNVFDETQTESPVADETQTGDNLSSDATPEAQEQSGTRRLGDQEPVTTEATSGASDEAPGASSQAPGAGDRLSPQRTDSGTVLEVVDMARAYIASGDATSDAINKARMDWERKAKGEANYSAAFRVGDEVMDTEGPFHQLGALSEDQQERLLNASDNDPDSVVSGFVDSNGNFVTSEEAQINAPPVDLIATAIDQTVSETTVAIASNETRKLGEQEPATTPEATASANDFEVNRDSAIAKVKNLWGQTVVPREPKNADEQDQMDFLRSRGRQAAFVDGDDASFSGALDESTGFMLIAGNRDTNDIWRTIGHEMAHATALDKVIPVDSAEMVAGRQKRLARSKGRYLKRLESEPELLDREARADIVGEFMRDKAFRDKLSRENPTLWERLREAVLKVVGKWTPRNEAQALVLAELRKQPAARKLGEQEAPNRDDNLSPAQEPELDEAAIDEMMEGLFDEEYGAQGTQETQAPEPAAPPRKLGQPKPEVASRKNPFENTGSGKEYAAAQKANPGKLIAFRMGDFYELFGDDARDAAKRLGLTLTSRDKDSDSPIPMAGFPHHQIQGYVDKMGGDMVAVEPGQYGSEPASSKQSPAKPKTNIEQSRDAVRKKKADLYKQWNDEAKGKLTSGLDPSLAKLAFDIAVAEIQDGTLTFAAYVENVAGNVSADLLEKAKPYFESAWRVAHKRGMTEDPAGKFDDVRAAKQEGQQETGDSLSPNRRLGDVDYGTVDNPNRVTLGEHFAERFRDGASYARITDARKEAAELIGGTPKDGTQAIKAIDESIELGVVMVARGIAQSGEPDAAIYDQLVDLYSRQPNLGTRTSTSMLNQAYSTPAPLAFVANRQAGITQDDTVYDSSAGNGMLLIVGGERIANELNPDRVEALEAQGIETTSNDATEFTLGKPITALAINPPFGELKNEDGSKKQWNIDGTRTDKVDHAITLKSLAEIPDNGKVAIIIGAKGFEQRKPKENKSRGRAYLKGKGFYDAVYDNYNVVDHYTVHGDLYSRQGAAFPVDVIIIEGRGASSRPKPYNITGGGIPQVFNSWQELKDAKLLGIERGPDSTTESRPANDEQAGVPAETDGTNESGPAGEREGTGGTVQPPASGGRRFGDDESLGRPSKTPGVPEQDQADVGTGGRGADRGGRDQQRPAADDGGNNSQRPGGAKDDDVGRDGLKQGQEAVADEESEIKGDQYQTGYTPSSSNRALGALIPNNHQTAVQAALDAVADRYGNIDEFVAKELGITSEQLFKGLAAEQIDALALGIARHKEGKAFILGDQTGVGKGRVAAGMMIYAIRQGFTPVFMTEKPTLYADMIRDMIDIGFSTDSKPFNPLMTNYTSKKEDQIKLPDGRILKQTANAAATKVPEAIENFLAGNGLVATAKKATKKSPAQMEEYDAIFTTYDQMVTVQGNLRERHQFLQKLSPQAFFVLDESHNAGGSAQDSGRQQSQDSDDPRISVAQMVRDLISAETAGVYFSSATYAKRHNVMDLYAKTGMTAATGEDGASLAVAIAAGGVPLQQVVSQQLVESGAYLRRERSFDDIKFEPKVYAVATEGAEQSAAIFRAINTFDRIKQQILQSELDEDVISAGGSIRPDWATGDAGMTSTNFSSILWNLTDQMLVASKADAIADEAIASLQKNPSEAPVIYIDSTMEAALERFVDSEGLQPGDTTEFSFRHLLQRYLERSREVLVQRDVEDQNSYEQVRLTDEQLGERGLAAFNAAQELIDSFDADMPASPIDWIRKRIEDAGYSMGEYTGRKLVMRYTDKDTVTLEKRPSDEVGSANRVEMVRKFNAGELDVILFNESGSTGISMHASEKNPLAGRKPRHMIIGQASKNIDTFMQSLGRVHRTGQVVPPRFTLAMSNLPAETRPASVLVKKLASLNANVTASDKGSVSFDIPDVMNSIGDRIVADYLSENDELNRALNEGEEEGLVSVSRSGTARVVEGIARKASGRMAIMPLETQQEFWDNVTETFNDLIEELDRMGANPLSAQVSELDARTIESFPIFDGDPEADNAFERPAYIEKVIAKRPGKPMTPDEVRKKVEGFYKLPESAGEQELRKAARDWQQSTIQEVRDLVADRVQSIREVGTARGDEESKIIARIQREEAVLEDFASMMRAFAPGLSLSIWEGGATETLDVIPGVVLSIDRKGKGGHPASMSKWRVEIAMGSPDRVMRLSLSQLRANMEDEGTTDAGESDREQEGYRIFSNRSLIDDTTLKDFEESEVSTVETRYIGTGNILAAFNIFREKRGRVTFFRDNEGNLRRGVLLPRRFNVDQWAKERPVVMDDVNQIRQFLSAGNYLETPDRALNVMMIRGDLVVRAPKSKARGGKYTLNPTILEASSPQEFVSIGARMEMVIDDPVQQDAVLESIVSVAPLQATSEKELARRIKNGDDSDDRPDVIRAFTAPATQTQAQPGGASGDSLSPASPPSSQRRLGDGTGDRVSPAEPVRQADIVTTWSRLFDVPIRIGGYKASRGKGKVALGIYNHLTEIVRMREGNAFNIIVASHEVGHHIDKKMNLYSGDTKTSKLEQLKATDKAKYQKVKAQLQALDYDYPNATRVDEGIAEAVRQIITGTAKNARLAPEAVAWVEEQIMADPTFGPAMKQAVEQAKQYKDQGAIKRAQMVFGGAPMDLDRDARVKKSLSAGVNRAYVDLMDRLEVVRQFSKDIDAARALEPGEASVYEEATAYQGTLHAHTNRAFQEGVHSLVTNEILSEPIANAPSLLKEGESIKDANAYAVARLTQVLPASYNTGMDRQDAKDYIAWVEKDGDRAQRWQKYHSLITGHNNAMVQVLVESGRISWEEGERILGPPALRALYVPLLREQTESDKGGRRLGAGNQMVELPTGFQRRSKSGSGRPVVDLLEATARKTMHIYSVAQRQLIHERMVNQTVSREGLGKWIDKIPPGIKVDSATVEQMLSQLVAGGFIDEHRAYAFRQAQKVREGGSLTTDAIDRLADMYEIEQSSDIVAQEDEVLDRLAQEPDINDVVLMYSPDYRRPNGRYVIKVIRRGNPQLYEVDPQLYEAFMGMAPETHTFITKAFDQFNRTFKAGAVGVNTAFLLSNAFADAGTFAINSQYTKGMDRFTKPWEWAARYGIAVALGKENELIALYRRHHGELYSYYGVDTKKIDKTLRRLEGKTVGQRLKDAGNLKGQALEAAVIVADGIEYFADYLRTLVAVSDVGARLAEAQGFFKDHKFELRDGRFYNTESKKFKEPSRDLVIKAMFAAGDVTYNYRRRGRIINGVERVFPFTNAALQSLDKTVRTYRNMAGNITSSDADKRKLGNQAFISLVTLSSIYFIAKALQLEDDEELDDWEQSGYVTITLPGNAGRISIRQSREHGWVANGAAAAMRYFLRDDKDALSKYVGEEIKNHFPVPGGGGAVGTGVEQLANYSLFRGRSIVPEHMRQGPSAVSPENQYDEYTTELSKLIGRGTGMSPMRIDHIMSGLTGGAYNRLAGTGEKIAVPMLQAMGTAKEADVQPFTARDIPFLRGIYRDSTPRASVSEFYDRLNDIEIQINDAVKAKVPPDAGLIQEKQQFAIAARMMKVLADASGPEYDSTANRVAVSRMTLGKSDHPNYPNPLYTDIPEEAAKEIRNIVFNDLDDLSRDLGRPNQSGDQTDEEYAEEIRVWEARRDGERAFWQRHAEAPIVQEAIKNVKQSKAFRDILLGKGKPRPGNRAFEDYAEDFRKFGRGQEAAREFMRFGQGAEQGAE